MFVFPSLTNHFAFYFLLERTVTLGFFDDILLPPTALQHPSRFEEAEQAWVWEYHPTEEAKKHDLHMDIGEPIKFRVSGEVFEESSPVGPPSSSDKQLQPNVSEAKTPYRIIVSERFNLANSVEETSTTITVNRDAFSC